MIWWQSTITKPVFKKLWRNLRCEGFSFAVRRSMKCRVQNTRILTPEELLTILCKSALLYSEYAETTLLFIFREKKSDTYDYYEVRF